MKKKLMLMVMAALMVISSIGIIGIANAATNLTVSDVNYSSDWNGVLVNFGTSSQNTSNFSPLDASKIEYKNAEGTALTATVQTLGNYALIQLQGATVTQGDKLTLKTGFYMLPEETVAEDIVYEYKTANSPWVVSSNEIPIEQCKDLAIADVYCFTDTTWGAPTVQFNFGTTSAGGFANYQGFPTEYIVYTNFFGETINVIDMTSVGTTYFISRLGESMTNYYVPMAGDTVTFKAGMRLNPDEALKADVTYVVTSASNAPAALFTAAPSAIDANSSQFVSVGATISVSSVIEPAETYGTVRYTSSDTNIATVSSSGVITGVAEGTATITVYLSDTVKDTLEISVLPAKQITGVELVGEYDYYVVKGQPFDLSSKITEIKFIFEDDSRSPALNVTADNFTYSVDTSAAGTFTVDVDVNINEAAYETDIKVIVYEFYDQEISEVGIVDWFAYSIFVQFPNSSTNRSNLTAGSMIPGILDYISYKRADGTEIDLNGYYILNENLALFMGFKDENGNPVTLTAENYSQYFLEGDILTLSQGLMMYKWTGQLAPTSTDNGAIAIGTGEAIIEGTLPETVQYRYNGNVWGIYVEYGDISVSQNTINIRIGDTAATGASRVPSNATTGTFVYTSSDTSIATVSANGVITGLKEGTAVITAELDGGLAGKKTTTVSVIVADYIKGLKITPSEISVKEGKNINLADLTAAYSYASGKAGEAVDLTGAEIIGFDTSALGEQQVIIKVTKDNVSYSGSITVTVTKAGCFSQSTASMAILLLAAAAFAIVIRLRKQHN